MESTKAEKGYMCGSVEYRRHESGTYFPKGTDPDAIWALEFARVRGVRVQLHYGYTWEEPGQSKPVGEDWLEEHDTTGTLGRSSGPCRVPILLHNTRSRGGPAVLSDCVVRIRETRSGRVLYQHPQYHRPEIRRVPSDLPDYTEAATVDGAIHARFKSRAAADRWFRMFAAH